MKHYISTVSMPEMANHMGIVHGGEIVKLMDNAAGIAAVRYCGGDVVTAHLETDFISKARMGEYLCSESEVVFTGRTSMIIYVCTSAENIADGKKRVVAKGYFTMVSMDEDGNAKVVKQISPSDSEYYKKASIIYQKKY